MTQVKIEGYSSEGPATIEADYFRRHPDAMPDEYVAGKVIRIGRKAYVRTGQQVTIVGVPCRVMAGTDWATLVVDTRRVDEQALIAAMPEGRLLRWQGLYWRVRSIKGVFVLLDLWGTSRRRQGWRLHTDKGVEYASRVAE